MPGIRRQRRSSDEWRVLSTRFACSGQTVRVFCQREPGQPGELLPLDMRKLFDGLSALATHTLGRDPLSGSCLCSSTGGPRRSR